LKFRIWIDFILSATKIARVKPHEQLLALSRKMQVNTEAPANEAKAEVRQTSLAVWLVVSAEET